MADNITLNSGSGGSVVAADDISSVYHQRVKIEYGVDGSATDVSDTNPLPVDDAGGSLTVDNAALSVVGGGVEATAMRVTIASDSTGVLSVDDNGAALTVDNAGTFAVQVTGAALTALQLIDDAISGTEMQVDVLTMPTVTVNAHAVTNAGTFAVQVDGAALTALQLIDDAISGTEMQVDVVGALPAGTNAIGKLAANTGVDIGDVDVTSVIPGTGATNAGKAVDSVAGATDTGVAALVVRDDALGALTPIEGDYVNLRVDANGALWTRDDVLEAALSGSELQVDVVAALPAGTNAIGKLAANSGVDIGDVDILSIAAGDNNIGNVDVVSLPASTNTLEVVGDGAADVATTGNPLLIGVQAETMADSAPATRVSADADLVKVAADRDGAVYVHPHGPQTWSYHLNTSTAQTDTEVHAAPAAGLSLYVTDIVFSSGAATAINAFFEEGASTVLGPYYLEAVAGRGMSVHFQTPKKITAATALTITTSAAIAHAVDVTGFVAPG